VTHAQALLLTRGSNQLGPTPFLFAFLVLVLNRRISGLFNIGVMVVMVLPSTGDISAFVVFYSNLVYWARGCSTWHL
jgi:hypothetical protein